MMITINLDQFKSSFKNDYENYETRGDKDKKLSIQQ